MALSHAILTALHDDALSGYDLARQFETSLGFFWRASHQQIYQELKRMAGCGWLAGEAVAQQGRPDKVLYRVTDTGVAELQRWLAESSRHTPAKDELFVKLYNLTPANAGQLAVEVTGRLDRHRQTLALYERIRDRHYAAPRELPPRRQGIWLALSAGIRHERMYIDWCQEALGLLAALQPSA